MVTWTGFADLTFPESAGLAFARALEKAETDAYQEYPAAWVIDDRRISFSIDADSARGVIEGTQRLLSFLVLEAVAGEVAVEVKSPPERWARKAALPSISKELSIPEDYEGAGETIRTAAS